MNIFALDEITPLAAQYHCDKHLIKMILETAQLLSTAHRILDGKMVVSKTKTGRNVKRWKLSDDREDILYSATHINHPSAVWCRQNYAQYVWLWNLMHNLCKEYTRCFGKVHKCESIGLLSKLAIGPINIKNSESFTYPTPAMPDYCKITGDVIQSYRNYYLKEKSRMFSWTNRSIPLWLIEMLDSNNIVYTIISESNTKGITNKLILNV